LSPFYGKTNWLKNNTGRLGIQRSTGTKAFFAGDVQFAFLFAPYRVKAVIKQSRRETGRRARTSGPPAANQNLEVVMKTNRSLMTLAGLSVALFALGATGAKAQSLVSVDFAGTFTLPFEAQWGRTILPVGEYSLQYGRPFADAPLVVEIQGKEKGSPHVFVLPQGTGSASTTKGALMCVREGNAGIVRRLEMPAIGKSVNFAMPRGAKLMAQNGKHNGYTQLAEAPMLIQRIALTAEKK
jgi:hypothetical protein